MTSINCLFFQGQGWTGPYMCHLDKIVIHRYNPGKGEVTLLCMYFYLY